MTRINLTDDKGIKKPNWFNPDTSEYFEESTYHNGSNYISYVTGSQFHHEGLYITKNKRYILNSWSDYQGSVPKYKEISKEEAVEWLIRNGYYNSVEELYPGTLKDYEI